MAAESAKQPYGVSLAGAVADAHDRSRAIVAWFAPGVVQVPHNGQPIVLMNDAQTTGGYPRIACIIEADMYHLAQIPLGQPIHFVQCSLEEALKARHDRQRYLEQLTWRLNNEN